MPLSEILQRDPVTATPETTTLEAIGLRGLKGVSCLPVVKEGQLVGIVSQHDFLHTAELLLERHREDGEG